MKHGSSASMPPPASPRGRERRRPPRPGRALTRERGAGSFTETELGEIKFPDISAPVLEKVCQYFYYKLKYMNRCASSFLPRGARRTGRGLTGAAPPPQ